LPASAHFLLLLGAAGAVFLAGGPPQGNLGLFLLCAGAAMLGCPPRVRCEGKFWLIGAGLLAAAALALLPQNWLPAPGWRKQLASLAVPLPPTISSHPQETAYWLAILGVTIFAGLFALSHPMRSRTQLMLAIAACAICGAYAALAIYVRQTGWSYPFHADPREFGFFFNRNHTSTFMVTGSVAAIGILTVAIRERRWLITIVAGASLTLCLVALIFFTKSRAGIIALPFGVLLWVTALGRAHRTKPVLVSFAAIFLAGLGLLMASQTTARSRLLSLAGVSDQTAVPKEGRILIFRDTLGIVRDYPITGTGLGTFRYVFPQYRERSLWEAPVLHPESDWLMFIAETGVPAGVLVGAGIFLLLRRSWALREHPHWPLRAGLLCAALAAFAHGMVDVPAHRVALGWWILVLFALGLQTTPPEPAKPSRLAHAAFVLAGLLATALGVQAIRAEWFRGPVTPPYAAFAAQTRIIERRVDGQTAEAADLARSAIRSAPLADPLYLQLGITLLRLGDIVQAESIFGAQRAINPNSSRVPVDQGAALISHSRDVAVALWVEAIRRQERIDEASYFASPATQLFQEMLDATSSLPDVQRALLAPYRRRPEFVFAWLDRAAPDLGAAEFPALADDAAFCAKLSASDRFRFLKLWQQRGDRERLFAWIAAHPEWHSISWPIEARHLVDEGRFAEAVRTAAQRAGVRLQLPDPDPDADAPAPEKPADAFLHYWKKRNILSARRTLEEARASASPELEIWRLSAGLAAHDGEWQTAWQHLERYLRETKLDSPQ
jgi:O-antigen ligase